MEANLLRQFNVAILSMYLGCCSVQQENTACNAGSPLVSRLEDVQKIVAADGMHAFQTSIIVGNRCLQEIREPLEMEYMLCFDTLQQDMPRYCLPSGRATIGWLDYLGRKRKKVYLEYDGEGIFFSQKNITAQQMLPSLQILIRQGGKVYGALHELK